MQRHRLPSAATEEVDELPLVLLIGSGDRNCENTIREKSRPQSGQEWLRVGARPGHYDDHLFGRVQPEVHGQKELRERGLRFGQPGLESSKQPIGAFAVTVLRREFRQTEQIESLNRIPGRLCAIVRGHLPREELLVVVGGHEVPAASVFVMLLQSGVQRCRLPQPARPPGRLV